MSRWFSSFPPSFTELSSHNPFKEAKVGVHPQDRRTCRRLTRLTSSAKEHRERRSAANPDLQHEPREEQLLSNPAAGSAVHTSAAGGPWQTAWRLDWDTVAPLGKVTCTHSKVKYSQSGERKKDVLIHCSCRSAEVDTMLPQNFSKEPGQDLSSQYWTKCV